MHSDPIADMLTRIRNAQAVQKPEIVLPYSKFKHAIAVLLKKEGWISDVEKLSSPKNTRQAAKAKKSTTFDALRIEIKYDSDSPKIKHIKRVSKPGNRVYVNKDELPYIRNNFGVAIISTSQGLMTNKEARKKGFGGEIVCEIY